MQKKRMSRVNEELGGETKNKSIKTREKNVLAKYGNRTTCKKKKIYTSGCIVNLTLCYENEKFITQVSMRTIKLNT